MLRLTKDKFDKPPITYTESLTKENIKDLLKEYEQVENIKNIKIGCHLRYFSKNKDNNYLFRLGGELKLNDSSKDYIVLKNRIKTWCVQKKDTIFFVKK